MVSKIRTFVLTDKGDSEELGEIVDLKKVLYELAGTGGLQAVEQFINEYYTEDIWAYFDDIGFRETRNEYNKPTESYLGEYQIGWGSLYDIGWVSSPNKDSAWSTNAALFGVKSTQDFRESETAQTVALSLVLRWNYMTLKGNGTAERLLGSTINNAIVYEYDKESDSYNQKNQREDVYVDLSGLLAASHLVGSGSVSGGGINGVDWSTVVDGNKTRATGYMDEFSGHDDVKKLLGYINNAEEVGIE